MATKRPLRLSRLTGPEYRHYFLLLFWPLFGLLFYSMEWLLPGRSYVPMHHPIDALIPFNELFVIPYVFWYVYMVFAVLYTCFREPDSFRKLSKFFILTFGGSILIFLLFPTCQNFRPVEMPRDNVLTRIMAQLYSMDTNTNVCPSLHTVGSIGAALGLGDTRRFGSRKWQLVNALCVVLISISTVFVRQHSILDVVWGVAYSFAAWLAVYGVPRKIKVASPVLS